MPLASSYEVADDLRERAADAPLRRQARRARRREPRLAVVLASIQRLFGLGGDEPSPIRQLEPGEEESVLSEGLGLRGELTGEGDLLILGKFEGEITVSGTVRVGAGAEVDANISATALVVAGVVRGNVSVATRVEMLPTGSLTGSLKSESLVAPEGASLKAEVWMESPSPLTPSAPAP